MQNDLADALKFIDVQDSFVLGFERHGPQYWVRALFALTPDHDAYLTPVADEYACYRHGWLKADGVSSVTAGWSGSPSADQDGEVDFGSFEQLHFAGFALICDGEWGQVRVMCSGVAVELDAA